MKVLVVGSGGREHTIAWKIKQSRHVNKIYCAPGNGGMPGLAKCVDIKSDDVAGLVNFAKKEGVDLTIVGPEAPLVGGIVNEFNRKKMKIFGPVQDAARLEGSKVFSKLFMSKFGIPTAEYEIFDGISKAKRYLSKTKYPVVVKADGLAAGKGVYVCQKKEDAVIALNDIMKKRIFGDAGNTVVIEECLKGTEASILAFSDGKTIKPMQTSQDHKRAYDRDRGPNTGGMGAYSPADVVSDDLMREIQENVLEPTIEGLSIDGCQYIGVLYAGVMLTKKGVKVLEFNVRLGDPETQVVLPRMKNDLVDVINACLNGTLEEIDLEWDDRACVCVVLASGGYPGSYEKGKVITGLDNLSALKSTVVFHAGSRKDPEGNIVTSGGRVLGVTTLEKGLKPAIISCYKTVKRINFDGMFYRKDIGLKAL